METVTDDDEGVAPGEEKLIPEWSVSADDQIVFAGLAVVAAFLALFGWSLLFGGDDTGVVEPGLTEAVAGPVVAGAADHGTPTDQAVSDVALSDPDSDDAGTGESAATPTTATPTTAAPTTAAPTTQAPLDLQPAVAAAVAGFAGAVAATDGTSATLTGYVGTDADRAAAETAAAEVPGIVSVDNQLAVLQPTVLETLERNLVDTPSVEMADTVATLRGDVPDDASRLAALDAASAVPGVSGVIDELNVLEVTPAVVTQLNELFELEPIQFASNSAQILEASFPTLDRAVAILTDNTAAIEIQGYTDIRGPELANLTLSQARADAVLAYLVDNGVDGEALQSTGYGETTQFGDGDTPDALAANRRVRFELI